MVFDERSSASGRLDSALTASIFSRSRAAGGKVERTKNMVLYYLMSRDLKKLEGAEFTMRIQKNGQDSVRITASEDCLKTQPSWAVQGTNTCSWVVTSGRGRFQRSLLADGPAVQTLAASPAFEFQPFRQLKEPRRSCFHGPAGACAAGVPIRGRRPEELKMVEAFFAEFKRRHLGYPRVRRVARPIGAKEENVTFGWHNPALARRHQIQGLKFMASQFANRPKELRSRWEARRRVRP